MHRRYMAPEQYNNQHKIDEKVLAKHHSVY